ncbi:predicted protein [Naegleria gruberi]|uniref:Predicted protein n=1 Tax=Naegleria gruberi TaxID=5762 RepID=D2W606_NAEGR|nr:uncharacterized protein NAEGRDRAFT_76849 [Naegleria gruberi]EFC35495.1 predicted protein [Naegleria gruberi]|eukprot:XP_002668239.1 predicted protein [Naegleria gruberi strain NEG-M]
MSLDYCMVSNRVKLCKVTVCMLVTLVILSILASNTNAFECTGPDSCNGRGFCSTTGDSCQCLTTLNYDLNNNANTMVANSSLSFYTLGSSDGEEPSYTFISGNTT